MTQKLKITNFVMRRLEKVKAQCSGSLFGFVHKGTLLIIGFNVETVNGALKYRQIQKNFPTDIYLCGLIKFGKCTDGDAHMNDILKDIDITDNPILMTCDVGSTKNLRAQKLRAQKFEEIPFEVMEEEELFRDFYIGKMECMLKIVAENKDESIRNELIALRKTISSGAAAFTIPNTSIVLTGGSSGSLIHGIDSEATTADLLNAISKQAENRDGGSGSTTKLKRKQIVAQTEHDVININVLVKKTKDKTEDSFKNYAGKITIDQSEHGQKIEIPIHLSALSILFRATKAVDLYDILVESFCNSLRLVEFHLIEQFNPKFNHSLQPLKAYHFFPEDFGHFFTCLYPVNVGDGDPYLVDRRKKLHHHFGIPLSRPHFRRTNCHTFKNEIASSNILINPHNGLKAQVPDGKQYLVAGKYAYHHYMQDNFNDDGWGCAYRSLQTLCSWFSLQGYSDHSIPTHRDIQKYLVDCRDKPANFLGSRQWIGSTEVSMCLNEFMKVDSKIMFVPSGGELAHKGAELSMHFEIQGTPIMIGGGVLAHTILGIDYNQTTGELKFLILDPHYTGGEDLHIIQSKGWCGWKNSDFWDKKSYYNLCMPQRPVIF